MKNEPRLEGGKSPCLFLGNPLLLSVLWIFVKTQLSFLEGEVRVTVLIAAVLAMYWDDLWKSGVQKTAELQGVENRRGMWVVRGLMK